MDLFEYQGKQFFARYGMPVSPGEVAFTVDEAVAAAERLGTPVMVKAQVHTGGRGKAGGVKFAATVDDVRTHAAALMVVLKPDGEVRSVRVLAFHEPLDYLPAEKWYAQFQGKTRADRLRVGSDVHAVVNATLSTRAASDGIRRVLAYHAVLIGGGD